MALRRKQSYNPRRTKRIVYDSPEVRRSILDALREGKSITDAAKYAGVSPDTYYRIISQDAVFAEEVEKVLAANDDKWKSEILEGIRLGMSPGRAALAAGMNYESCYALIKKDPIFAAACEQAGAECERDRLRLLSKGPKGWQAQAWILERRFRDEWRPPKLQISDETQEKFIKVRKVVRRAEVVTEETSQPSAEPLNPPDVRAQSA